MYKNTKTVLTLFLIFLTISKKVAGEDENKTTTERPMSKPQPIYVPQAVHPYSIFDSYNAFYPQPASAKQQNYPEEPNGSNYVSAIIPATQVLPKITLILEVMSALQFTLKALAKFGLFLLGGATLLMVGGIFTTIICYLTPICVISFPGFNQISKESVRSLMTPDKISAAAAMVQDAIGKYQRLQRAVEN